MKDKSQLFISIALILIYVGFTVKKKVYVYGGFVFILLTVVAFGGAQQVANFLTKSSPILPTGVLLWTIYLFTAVIVIAYVLYSYREETTGQNPPILKEDVTKILKLKAANILFLIFLFLFNIIVFSKFKN